MPLYTGATYEEFPFWTPKPPTPKRKLFRVVSLPADTTAHVKHPTKQPQSPASLLKSAIRSFFCFALPSNPVPPSAPRSRRRRSAYSIPRLNISDSVLNPNTGSLFFCLPPELRLQIYALVLNCPGQTYHIIRLSTTAKIGPLTAPSQRIAHIRCHIPTTLDPTPPLHFQCLPARPSLSDTAHFALLRACRRIYTEALPLPYSQSKFSFDTPSTLPYFARSVPSHHLRLIRSLSTYWPHSLFNYDGVADVVGQEEEKPIARKNAGDIRVGWKLYQFCDILSSRMQVSELALAFEIRNEFYGRAPMRMDAAWVRPLLRIKGLEKVSVRIIDCDRRGEEAEVVRVFERELERRMVEGGGEDEKGRRLSHHLSDMMFSHLIS